MSTVDLTKMTKAELVALLTKAQNEASPTGRFVVTKEWFLEHAEPIQFDIQGSPFVLSPTPHSTGSYGMKSSGMRLQVLVDGKIVEMNGQLILTVSGSSLSASEKAKAKLVK